MSNLNLFEMKKFLLPIAVLATFSLVSCGDEALTSECNNVKTSDLPEDKESCKISDYKADIGYCTDEDTEDVYFTYKGSGHYESDDDLILAVCPKATKQDRNLMVSEMTREGRSLIQRIRMSAFN